MFGLGRPQPTSAEKIAAVENELKVVAEMHSRYVFLGGLNLLALLSPFRFMPYFITINQLLFLSFPQSHSLLPSNSAFQTIPSNPQGTHETTIPGTTANYIPTN